MGETCLHRSFAILAPFPLQCRWLHFFFDSFATLSGWASLLSADEHLRQSCSHPSFLMRRSSHVYINSSPRAFLPPLGIASACISPGLTVTDEAAQVSTRLSGAACPQESQEGTESHLSLDMVMGSASPPSGSSSTSSSSDRLCIERRWLRSKHFWEELDIDCKNCLSANLQGSRAKGSGNNCSAAVSKAKDGLSGHMKVTTGKAPLDIHATIHDFESCNVQSWMTIDPLTDQRTYRRKGMGDYDASKTAQGDEYALRWEMLWTWLCLQLYWQRN